MALVIGDDGAEVGVGVANLNGCRIGALDVDRARLHGGAWRQAADVESIESTPTH
jgi:hypothetical protein